MTRHAHPRRVDWWRLLGLALMGASVVVTVIVGGWLVGLAMALLG